MMHHVMKGIAKTAMDGLKDAEMQYGYAMDAHAEGSHEFAALHIEEAKHRLSGVKEWYDRGVKLMGGDMRAMDPVAEALVEHYKNWYHTLSDKIASFKPGQ